MPCSSQLPPGLLKLEVTMVMGQEQGGKGRQSLSWGCGRWRVVEPCVSQGSDPLQHGLASPSDCTYETQIPKEN